MNVLRIDMDKYTVEQARDIFNHVKEKLGDDLMMIPADISLLVDCDIYALRQIKERIEHVIRLKEHADEHN